MSDPKPSNAKIYARPENKPPSPLILVVSVLLMLIIGFFVYRFFFAPKSIAGSIGSVAPISRPNGPQGQRNIDR